MENDRTEGKGQVDSLRQMDEDALAYARALQSSAPRLEEGGGMGVGGTVSASEGQEVQSGEPAPTTEAAPAPSDGGQEGSGQGFLEPYLKDVPEDQRGVVEPILEKYRQEQDANFNRRFEQLQEEANVPVTLYNSLLQDPIQTLNWIADRMYEERGLDVRSQLLEAWAEGQQTQAGQEGQPPAGEENADKPLTQADIDRILQEREEQRTQQQRQEEWNKQQVQKQQETVNNWVDESAKKFSLSLNDPDGGEDPLRAVIIMQANALHEQGVARGQAAIEMATESVAKRFGASNGNSNSGNGNQQPITANGGSPPPSKEIDVSDPKQRKGRMLELLTPPPVQ